MRRICLLLSALPLLWTGCGEPFEQVPPADDAAPAVATVHASVDAATRTLLGGGRGTEVLWSAGDRIGLWGDASAVNRRYDIDERHAGSASADFTGEQFESATYFAYYPYDEDAEVDDSGVATTLRAVQPYGGSGTFAAASCPMAARSTAAGRLQFGSLCGVVRLQLTGEASIRSIRLTALDGAVLAGRVRFACDAAGGWSIEPLDAGRSSIVLDCGEQGVQLSPAEPISFCLVVPPGSYSRWRFDITDTAGGRMVRTTTKAAVVLEANHIKTYNPLTYKAEEQAPVALDAAGTANCYVVPGAGCYDFDAATMGNGAVTRGDATYVSSCGKAAGIRPEPLRPVSAGILWQTAKGLVGNVTLGEEGRVRFTTANPFVEGNAVVAVCDAAGTILWSWHLWLTAADLEGSLHRYALPEDYAAAGEAVVMDRNLGALAAAYDASGNVADYGMFYQWGRKDPFVPYRNKDERVPVYDAAGKELDNDISAKAAFDDTPGWHLADGESLSVVTVEDAVHHPMNFITEISNPCYNWYTAPESDLRNDLWGCPSSLAAAAGSASKTIYDPCPPGYRVAHRFIWTAFADSVDAIMSQWYIDKEASSSGQGVVFTVSGQRIFYPAAGVLLGVTGRVQYAGNGWYVWSNSPYGADNTYAGAFYSKSTQGGKLLGGAHRSYGAQVRCMKE